MFLSKHLFPFLLACAVTAADQSALRGTQLSAVSSRNLITNQCNDGNACTADSYDDVSGTCVHDVIMCDDGDPTTFDTCDPTSGCKYLAPYYYNFSDSTADPTLTLSSDTYFYEDKSTLTQGEVSQIISWIKAKVTEIRIPYCLKQFYPRPSGISACPSGKEKVGELCYPVCPSGYYRDGIQCIQNCLPGWTDLGKDCVLEETSYARTGYVWRFGDPYSDNVLFSRCEADWGVGNCERCGIFVYPKCKPGYNLQAGCDICQAIEPEGCETTGSSYVCTKTVIAGDPSNFACASGLEEQGGQCFMPCKPGFNGDGPFCLQSCNLNTTNGDAGATSSNMEPYCGSKPSDETIAQSVVAANIANLGLEFVPLRDISAGFNGVKIGYHFAASNTAIGEALIWLASKLQNLWAEHAWTGDTPYGATLWERIEEVQAGSTPSKLFYQGNVDSKAYSAVTNYNYIVANNFAEMTSPEIDLMLNEKLNLSDAIYVKHIWAMLQFNEIALFKQWPIAQTLLDEVSLIDISVIASFAAAYSEQNCFEVIPFPYQASSTSMPIEVSNSSLANQTACTPTSSPACSP